MKISLAADHNGFDLKNEISDQLEREGHEVMILDSRGGKEDTTQTSTYSRFGISDEKKAQIFIQYNSDLSTHPPFFLRKILEYIFS